MSFADAYAESAAQAERSRRERVRRDLAKTYRPDDGMERLAGLRESDPAAYGRLNAAMKLRLGYYLHAKEAAEAEKETAP